MACRPSRLRALAALGALVALAGCGTKFDLPTERRENRAIPADKSYEKLAAWPGMDRVRDLLLTQKYGSQLFILFERATPDTFSHGEARRYALTLPVPIPGTDMLQLNNPVALAAGGDGTGSPLNRVYVLDQGDTCEARANPVTHQCGDISNGWSLGVSDLFHYWRVREYGLRGGDTLSTFTDTSMAFVRGVAADSRGRVYVAGMAIILVPDISNPRLLTRSFESRIYRYERGPRYPGVVPPDRRMPGANWHRDSTWVVVEGSGVGSIMNPHGLEWMDSPSGSALYVSDYDKNWIQRMSDTQSSTGFYQIDAAETGTFLFQAGDVAADASGFVYICDTGNRRVLRYDSAKEFVQRVDLAAVGGIGPLVNPVAVAANDTVVFIADPGNSTVLKMVRR
jgi:hypothetical protein